LTVINFVYFAQIAGSLALILTLVFVAVQVRQHNVASRARTVQSSVEFWTRFYSSVLEAESGAAFAKGASGKNDLSTHEFAQFFVVCRNALLGAENLLYQYREGLMDEESCSGYTAYLRDYVANYPGFRAMWKLTRSTYGKELRAFIDEQVAAAPVARQTSLRGHWRELAVAELGEELPDHPN